MLLRRETLDGVAAGTITCVFRRWRRPTVRAGGRLRTAVGVLAIDAVDPINLKQVTATDARGAGYPSRAALLNGLAAGRGGQLYRIRLHLAGPDPRVALREDDSLDDDALATLHGRLERLDAASRHGPWTRATLAAISQHPTVRAAALAAALGRDTPAFKTDVRKLKNLGLTESLETGYRLSPRGRAVLAWLDHRAPPA